MAVQSLKVEQALAAVEQQGKLVLNAAQAAFKRDMDPLGRFGTAIASTTVVHARAMHTMQEALLQEMDKILRVHLAEVHDRIEATSGSGQPDIVISNLLVRDPKSFIRILLFALPVMLFVGFIGGVVVVRSFR